MLCSPASAPSQPAQQSLVQRRNVVALQR